MSYQYDLILKKSVGCYELITLTGRVLFTTRDHRLEQAMNEANAYMSTWMSVRIRTEEEYEQDEKRNRVPTEASGLDTSVGQHPDLPKDGKSN